MTETDEYTDTLPRLIAWVVLITIVSLIINLILWLI